MFFLGNFAIFSEQLIRRPLMTEAGFDYQNFLLFSDILKVAPPCMTYSELLHHFALICWTDSTVLLQELTSSAYYLCNPAAHILFTY